MMVTDRFAPPTRPCILIVDDTPTNLQMLARGLSKKYTILVAPDGQSALTVLTGPIKPDLILLDIMMPDLDGYEVCRRIKQEPTLWNIPIIFLTAKGAVADQQLGFDLGAVDYIVKPIEIPLLMARVAVHIRLKRKSEQLEKLAMIDALTDIANRRALEEMLARECGRAARNDSPLAVLMIDIDHFKSFNDHYGHGAGDECLRRVAQILAATLKRPGDFIARYGGEEFFVILPQCDANGAMQVAESLRGAVIDLTIPHAHSSALAQVTISVGVTARQIGAEITCAETLKREADDALYAAKSQGRNRAVVFGLIRSGGRVTGSP